MRRARRVAAPLEQVWSVVSDPYRLPRWWPRTRRVEGVSERGWTSVLVTPRGHTIRADYRVAASEPLALRRWALEVEDSPFERLLAAAETELRLRAAGEVTEVSLALRERPRGWARFGALVLRRAGGRTLDDALSGLATLLESTPDPSQAAPSEGAPAGGSPSQGAPSGAPPAGRRP